MKRLSDRLEGVTGGSAALPLLLLFVLNMVDELDQVAFGILAPEIAADFNISESSFVSLATVAGALVIVLIVPVGVLADRHNRVRMSAAAALAWSTMSVLTGLAPALAILVLARFGSGLGRVMNEPVHASLLADYYPPAQHGKVFSFHRFANTVGALLVLVAGTLGAVFGWRATFILLALPTIPAILLIRKLEEPVRGASLDVSLAFEADSHAERVGMMEAFRRLAAIPTLKRMWVTAFFFGAGLIPIATFSAFFYENVYGLGPGAWGRAGIHAILAIGAMVGLRIGSRLATATIMRGEPEGLARLTGLSILTGAGALAFMASAPWVGLSIVGSFLIGVTLGGFGSYYLPLIAAVSPPRLRSQSFGWIGLWFAVGAIVLAGIVGNIADERGYRYGITTLAFVVAIAGGICLTIKPLVRKDADNAFQTLQAEARVRRRRAAGEDDDQPLLVCSGVDVAYDQVQVLFGVDFEVRQGEIVALLGTNGAGKSTLLKAISGLALPSRGSVIVDGADVTNLDARRSAELGIIQMPGGRSVFPTLTVGESLRLAGWLYKRSDPAHVEAATAQVLEYFPILRDRSGSLAGDLSGGEQQMLGLGMAFIAKPKLLMIDELSLGLAPTIVERLVDIVRAIHAAGTTVIVVEQSVNVALLLAKRAVFMEKGEVRFSGPTADLLGRDDLLRSVFLEGASANGPAGNGTPAVTKEVRTFDLDTPAALELHGITRRFGGIVAVSDVSLRVAPGEIVGLIGPNGAGKTTVLDLISGFLTCDAGRVVLGGVDITAWSPDRRAWAGLGRSFQDARLFPSLTVAENIAVGLERHLDVRDPFAAAIGLPDVRRAEDDVRWAVHELIELMQLGAYRNKFVGELSTGTRRVVDLCLSIAHDPDVLLLDEPSSGIAQRETEALGPLLRRIQAEARCCMVVIEHDMPLITTLADRMYALELGSVIAEGTPAEVTSHPHVVASYLGASTDVIARSGSRA